MPAWRVPALRAAARTRNAGDAQRDRRAAGARDEARHRAGDSRPLSRATALVCGEGQQDPRDRDRARRCHPRARQGLRAASRSGSRRRAGRIATSCPRASSGRTRSRRQSCNNWRWRACASTGGWVFSPMPLPSMRCRQRSWRASRRGAWSTLPDGELRWLATSQEIPTAPPGAEIRRLSAEQSNTSLILGDIAVLKILRRVQAGRHPQTEMTRYLTEHGYANSPALFGEMVRVDADGTPQTLLIAERFVPNQGDAWQWTLDRVRRAHPCAGAHRDRRRGGAGGDCRLPAVRQGDRASALPKCTPCSQTQPMIPNSRPSGWTRARRRPGRRRPARRWIGRC